MRKQRRQLILLIAVLAALGGCFLALKQYNRAQEEKPPEPEGETVLLVDQDDIVRLSYDYEGENYRFEKEGDTWYYAPDHALNIMQYKIDTMLRNVSEITALDAITDVSDASLYGFDGSARTITFEALGESHVIEVGNYNEIADVCYIRLASAPNTVYAVSAMTVDAFDYKLDDLVEPQEENEETKAAESGAGE